MTARYLIGDVLEVLPTLEENSVDLILTSPPFLALRSYLPADHPDKSKEGGSQPTPGAFIDWLVDVVEALDRVLAPHGSMVIELGDTYAGSGGAGGDYNEDGFRDGQAKFSGSAAKRLANGVGDDYRPSRAGRGDAWPADKSLTLIPELFRMTLVYGFNPLTGRQTRRWRLRNVVRWVRPNPPVGALGDKFRPATSELMVFCRTDEAGRRRYFDLDAVREPAVSLPQRFFNHSYGMRDAGDDFGKNAQGRPPLLEPGVRVHPAGAPPLDWWNIPLLDGEEPTRMGPNLKPSGPGSTESGRPRGFKTHHTNTLGDYEANPLGAPPLDWWNIPPGGYQGAHYAVFPEALCVRPIKAMSPERVCKTCGEPSRRIVGEAEYVTGNGSRHGGNEWGSGIAEGKAAHSNKPDGNTTRVAPTLGFTDCSHDNYRPGLVLDPFAGSGTTLAVAVGHGRDAVGIDLDERNARLAEERIGFFLEVVTSIS